jgi:hypothetical protein
MSTEQTEVVTETTESTTETSMSSLLAGDIDTTTTTTTETETNPSDVTTETTDTTDRPEWLPEKFKSPESMAEAYKNLESKFGGFTGAPEDYELTVPEGVDFQFYEDSEYGVNTFKEFAKETNMSQETFSKAMDFYINSRAHDAIVEQQNRENAVYEVFGGKDKAVKDIPNISAKVKGALGEDGMKVYQDAASGSVTAAASAIKLAGMLINKFDGEFKQSTSVTPQPSISRDSLREMMKDPRYKTSAEFRAQVDEGYKKLFDK